MRHVNGVVLSIVVLFFPIAALAGSLDSPAAPTSATSAMYTLEDIYNRLNANTQGTKRAGAFTEPSAAPGSTGHTLDQVYEKAIPTQVPKTGQTAATSRRTGDDGDLQKGVAWPTTRFTDNGDGTVTDKLTGLIWLKDANCTDTVGGIDKSIETPTGTLIWGNAIIWSNNLADGNCGLTDGSSAGDWRLPNIKEIFSLIDYGTSLPALPANPFTNVKGDVLDKEYWSSTLQDPTPNHMWSVRISFGSISSKLVSELYYVWPVRGGQ
jgi:hypothetical protein